MMKRNKLFKDVEVELKEKYNVVLNIIICYNIKDVNVKIKTDKNVKVKS